jgi:hypothetical protein
MNAKEELLDAIKDVKRIYNADLLCASIDFDDNKFELKEGYTKEEFDLFLSSLDFEYRNGNGVPFLEGKVWLTDGVWLDRCSTAYYYSWWWEIYKCPEPPANLRKN